MRDLLNARRQMMVVALSVAVSAVGLSPVHASAPTDKPSYWHPWFEIGGYHNSRDDDGTGSFGTNRGETTIFAPISGSEKSLLFGQVTAKFFEGSAKEGNLAIGYRRMTWGGFNLGAWIGGDVRRTEIDNTFWQLSGGFEALSKNVDFRVNWYGPVTDPQAGIAGFAQLHLQGNQIFMTGGQEVGLKGFDGEVGFRIPIEALRIDPNRFELRAYAGGYHFDHDDAIDKVAGAKGRVELRINDVFAAVPGSRLTAEYEITHDDVRDTRHEVGMRLRIPLNGGSSGRTLASLSHQQRRMLDGIERDTDIITVRSKAEKVEDALTGTDFDRVAYASRGNDVTTTSNAAGDNSLIILNGRNRGEQVLQANQTLQGGGSTIAVRGLNSGLVLPFTAPGSSGRLVDPGRGNDNLEIDGSNTHVSGITIVGGRRSDDGVDIGNRKSNVFLTNLNIRNTGDDGVDIDNRNSGITLINVNILNPDDDGIEIGNGNQGIAILGGSIRGAGDHGLQIGSRNTVSTKDLDIRNIDDGDAFRINGSGNTLNVIGGLIRRVDSDAFDFSGSRNIASITGTVFERVDDDVFDLDGNEVSVSGILVRNSSDVVNVEGRRNQVSVTNSTFSRITDDVFDIANRGNTLSVTNSVFNRVSDDLFRFEDANGSTVFVANNTINGPIGGFFFTFEGTGTTNIQAGSVGNINNTGFAPPAKCIRGVGGPADFTGQVVFDNGVVRRPTCPLVP